MKTLVNPFNLVLLTLVGLTFITMNLYMNSFMYEYSQTRIPSDVVNSLWTVGLIGGVFIGLFFKVKK